jgi:hypothetical protein
MITSLSSATGAATPEAPSADDGTAAHRRRRGMWAWVAIGTALLLVGAAGAAIASSSEWFEKGLLDPESAGPVGARALAQVLRENGVPVDVVRTRDAARDAVDADTTLVLPSTAVLSDGAVRDITSRAGDVVLVDPAGRDIRLLFDGAETGGFGPSEPVAAECAQPDAERAGSIVVGTLFTVGGGESTVGCFPVDGGFGLLAADHSATSRTVAVDARELFTNEHLADGAHASLAVGLLGRHPRVVWFMPSTADGDAGAAAGLGELTPPWVTPAVLLLLCAGIIAALWRGRRFGPLVAENLPVMVRAAETMEGRARLYARSRDAVHALDALRLGTLDRLARLLALGPSASAGEIADAAAERIGAPRDVVRGILIDVVPSTEGQLVDASERLRNLEEAVQASVRTERIDP